MIKKTILISVLLLFGLLLAACGETAEHTDGNGSGHGGHDADQTTPQNDLTASFTFASGAAKANEQTELTVKIDKKDGAPVNKFDVNHEKLLHLIIVDHDLSYFNHIHPDYQGDGRFTVGTAFPSGGRYKLFADFVPSGGSATTLSEWVDVEGEESRHAPVAADPELIKQVDGKGIELAISSTRPKEDVTLTFQIRDAETKKGIENLEPYLGAVGHVVILSQDAELYLHVHPLDEKATGPTAEFATTFPESGTYKVWGQFQHEGKVFTVPFVIDVK